MDGATPRPWYREPWPWILMAGPAAVIVAGFATVWLAVRSNDGLVVDDYYKRGLAINRTLGRSDAALRNGIKAQMSISEGRVRVELSGAHGGEPVILSLVHPTRAGMDQRLTLSALGAGVYEGRVAPLAPGKWHVVIEQRDWRLAGIWALPAANSLTLGVSAASKNTDK